MKTCQQSRRELLRSTAAISMMLAGCKPQQQTTEAAVSVIKAPAYSDALYDTVYRIFVQHRLEVAGKRVLLKPNLVEFNAEAPINTHPMLVHAAIEALRKLGARDVLIAEGPGHRRLSLDMAEEAGFFKAVPDFENRFVDLNLDNVTRRQISHPRSKLREVYLPNTLLGCDLVISMPKMKTHHWAGATLSMKNLFGIVPGGVYGWPKNILHWAGIDESIVDLQQFVPRSFALVDGIEAMEGNGPIQGTRKHVGLLVAGRNMVAVDATCCELMGIDPQRVGYLQLSGVRHYRIHQRGEETAKLRTPFVLAPGLDSLRAL